jgi:hypothetical protein
MIELIDASTGLPWLHTTIVGFLFSCLLLFVFPIKQLRNFAALAPQ